MLEVIREYARERLDSLDLSEAYERAFAAYYVGVTSRDAREQANRSAEWLDLIGTEYANIRAVLRWSVEHDRSLGLQLALRLPEFWERQGLYTESREWLEMLVAPLEQTIESEDSIVAWRAINALALSYYWNADPRRACALHRRALAITRGLNDPAMTAKSLNNLGLALLDADEPEQARGVLEESLAIKESRDDAWSIGSTVGNLGIALRMCGEYERALECHQRARNLFRSVGDALGEVGELNFIGDVYRDRGEYQDAASCYARSLEANTEEIRPQVAHSLEGLVTLASRRNEFRRVAVLAAPINRIWSETGRSESPSVTARFERACAAARISLGDPSFDDAWNEGTEMSLEDAIEVGRAIGVDLCASRGRPG